MHTLSTQSTVATTSFVGKVKTASGVHGAGSDPTGDAARIPGRSQEIRLLDLPLPLPCVLG